MKKFSIKFKAGRKCFTWERFAVNAEAARISVTTILADEYPGATILEITELND